MLLASSGRPGHLPPVNESDLSTCLSNAAPDIYHDAKLGGRGPYLAGGALIQPTGPALRQASAAYVDEFGKDGKPREPMKRFARDGTPRSGGSCPGAAPTPASRSSISEDAEESLWWRDHLEIGGSRLLPSLYVDSHSMCDAGTSPVGDAPTPTPSAAPCLPSSRLRRRAEAGGAGQSAAHSLRQPDAVYEDGESWLYEFRKDGKPTELKEHGTLSTAPSAHPSTPLDREQGRSFWARRTSWAWAAKKSK